jgi:hypothetical protein
MKKLLLFSFSFLATVSLHAQLCTPGANFADSTYGVWPDTIQNFPPAAAGVPYSTDLNFKVPNEVTAEVAGDDPAAQAVIGSAIQDFTVTGVGGLPTGIDYACNISSCTYLGGSNGCANLFGTTNSTGTYPITIDVEATVLVELIPGFPAPLAVPTTFSGYKLVVGTAGSYVKLIEPFSVHPNPANTKITLNGLSDKLNISSISISNMEGKMIRTITSFSGETLDVNVSSFESGVYFINIAYESGSETIKFVKD